MSEQTKIGANPVTDEKEAATVDKTTAETVVEEASLYSVSVKKARMTFGDFWGLVFSKRIINRIIVFLIAAVMLILAFCPFAYTVSQREGWKDVTLRYNAVDTVSMAVRSFFFLDEEELRGTELYKDILTDTNEARAMKKGLLLMVMSRDASIRLTVVLAAVVSVVYICLCILFLLLAAFDLLGDLITIKKKRGPQHECSRPSDGMLLAILCILPLLIFTFGQMSHFGLGAIYENYTGGGNGLSWGLITSITVALIGALFVFLKNGLNLTFLPEKYFNKQTAKSIVCCALVAVVILSVFLPCIDLHVSTPNGKQTRSVLLAPTDIHEMTADDIEYYQSNNSNTCREELDSQINEALTTFVHDDTLSWRMLVTFMTGVRRNNVNYLYGIVMTTTILTLISACVLLWLLLHKVFMRGRLGFLITVFKLVTLISSTINFIMYMVLILVLKANLTGDMLLRMDPTLSVGAFLMIICAIAALLVKVKAKRQIQVDRAYDNPDVSYAPYVIVKK